MTRKRSATRSKRSFLGKGANLLRAVVLEGVGIMLLAGAIGYPMLTQSQWRVSCLDCEPSVIDQGLHTLLAKVGLVSEPD